MSQIKSISIPEKCHQSWSQMSPNSEGRHCQSCNKTVIDFSTMSNQQIISYLGSNAHLCGKFNDYQLININNSINTEPLSRSTKIKGWALAISILSSITFYKANAQHKAPTAQSEQVIGKIYSPPQEKNRADTTQIIEIKGIVYNETSLPICGATIICPTSHLKTQTNASGQFKLSVPINTEKFIISFLGYSPQWVNVDVKRRDTTYNIKLTPAPPMIGEVIIIKQTKPGYTK